MRALLLTIVIILSSNTLFSQGIPDFIEAGYSPQTEHKHSLTCSHSKHFQMLAPEAKSKIRNYDVIEYDIYMDWSQVLLGESSSGEHRYYNGTNAITIEITDEEASEIILDQTDLLIKEVKIGETNLDFEILPDEEFIVELDKTYSKEEILTLDISYQYQSNVNNGGFYYYPRNESDITSGSAVHHNIAYTMSEPYHARKWVPCNDWPHDKALVTIKVDVPKGYTVAANGTLVEKIDNENGTVSFHWKSRDPMPSYLMAASASVFEQFSDTYQSPNDESISLFVHNFCWPEDAENIEGEEYDREQDGHKPNAKHYFRNTVEMMEYFSQVYVEYPFEKYGHVVVNPYNYGGMEHQTISTMHRFLIFAKSPWDEFRFQNTIVHELGHQWLGDLISCATWNDLWINEGGASWTEALWHEQDGIDVYLWYMGMFRDSYLRKFGVHDYPIYGLPYNILFNYELTYAKSAWVYHMLRNNYQGSEYFEVLRDLLNENAYTSMTTEDFKDFLKNHKAEPKVDLDTFFNQWLMSPGHPKFDARLENTTSQSGKFNYKLTLSQFQNGFDWPETFHVPLKIYFTGGIELQDTIEVINTKKLESFDIELDFPVNDFFIDTLWTLCQVNMREILVSVDEIGNNNDIRIYPNPIFGGDFATLQLHSDGIGIIEVDIFDSYGRKVKEVFKGINKNDNRINTEGLSAGTYFIVISNQSNKSIKKLSVIK
jgi:aminopeptidase N